jgi:hypothetical protein
LKNLADPEIRARLKREVITGSPGWSNLVEASGGWDHIVLANARNEANAKFENKSIAAIGKSGAKIRPTRRSIWWRRAPDASWRFIT